MTAAYASYAEAFAALKKANATLSGMTEPDVDAIAPCVETAVLAGDFCLKRIAAVRAVVENLRKAANAEGKEIGA